MRNSMGSMSQPPSTTETSHDVHSEWQQAAGPNRSQSRLAGKMGVKYPKKGCKMATFAGKGYVTGYGTTSLLPCCCVKCRRKKRRETNSRNHLLINNETTRG